jgi:hypothetical protein
MTQSDLCFDCSVGNELEHRKIRDKEKTEGGCHHAPKKIRQEIPQF